MRVAIVSRIFPPEPAAASFRLSALADALKDAGHDVTVLTVKPPKWLEATVKSGRPKYDVRRFPVVRDKSGYVRGYVPYLSFDVPLFFRLLLGRQYDLIVSEPPPTTGFFVRLATMLRRMPYAYYAADIWSEASTQTTAPGWMVNAVRWIERFAMKGARVALSVSDDVTTRIAAMGVTRATTVGNGGDIEIFRSALAQAHGRDHRVAVPTFVYAGTASEWHGAEVFVDAMPELLAAVPTARLRFIGGGSERDALKQRADDLGVRTSVTFEDAMAPALLAPILHGATAAVASVRPGSSYEFAFPTKLYSAIACGAPIIYSGRGPTSDFVETLIDGLPIGACVDADRHHLAQTMIRYSAETNSDARRDAVSKWAEQNVSLRAVSKRAVRRLEEALRVDGKDQI
ncbi:glycosyltransferase family 4 protein [Leucobacter alluvii]|uniref:D-inositol 3-phosphate glycosyltransferase n=1 Tax=Leucobacter alluvii TaxID=340321 RepID=A0ABP5N2Q3_9MICO